MSSGPGNPAPEQAHSAPLCFVVMPFGTKPDGEGGTVDFDTVYFDLLAPAIREAELEPLRADQELVGGLVHKPMFERLILSDYALADLTTANANVFYELGVRHALRPYSTVLVTADVKRAPFDIAPGRMLPYRLDASGHPLNGANDRERLVEALWAARRAATDSPVFQLIDRLPRPEIDFLKTDAFRDEAARAARRKQQLAEARRQDVGAVRRIETELGPLHDVEAGVLIDLLISYRATGAWDEMIRLIEAMSDPVRRTRFVRELYGFALNRASRGLDAERVLLETMEEYGPSSEIYGLLGRVYKDRWESERQGSILKAAGCLDQAIAAYRAGFEFDWRDPYPGVNAVTLMEIRVPGGNAQQDLAPVVRYSNRRRIARSEADYWDHATRVELAVVARDRDDAIAGAQASLAVVREAWQPLSTAHNLRLIREARAQLEEVVDWADRLERELQSAASRR